MKTNLTLGMLWYDPIDDLRTQLERASAYYAHKYANIPTVCHINPAMLDSKRTITIDGRKYKIVLDATIQPDHLWIGVVE